MDLLWFSSRLVRLYATEESLWPTLGSTVSRLLQFVSRHDTHLAVIQSARGKLIEQVLAGKPGKGFPSDLFRVAVRKIAMLEAATKIEDLRVPPGNRLEALSDDRKGQHSIRINDQWRVCFIWTDNGPEDVEIVDYH